MSGDRLDLTSVSDEGLTCWRSDLRRFGDQAGVSLVEVRAEIARRADTDREVGS